VDGLVAIAKNELDFLREYNLHQPAVYIPTGFDLGTRESGYGNDFFHLAAMDWQPNIQGLTWFLKEVWQHSPCAKNNLLHLAGKGLDKQQYNNYDGLKNHGPIPDSQAFMCDYGIMLVPLFEGSGLRIKIIEAGALGVPIIATTKAVEGIGLLPNVHFLEANTSNEFEKAMQLLVNDVSLRQSLGAAIRVFMQQNYNQDIFNDRLIEFYQNI
jgi:glycosyltransferase involved in cell wall biosynthesis